MINIAILTSTRAEYGLMRQLIFNMTKDCDIDMHLLVTGTHLSSSFGYTVNEIKEDGVKIEAEIDILAEKDGAIDVTQTFSNAVALFGEYFENNRYDYLLVDGDRYEILAASIAAVMKKIPVIHCGGGATTEGANDEYWRHALTKISSIHFPTMEVYRKRIINMGETPDRVFTVGSMGLENIRCMPSVPKEEIDKKVGLKLNKPYALVTFHPVTLENGTAASQIEELLAACEEIKDMIFIFTKANADQDGQIINAKLEEYAETHRATSACVASLGVKCYISAMRDCEFVIGNSSSGIIETPSVGKPTINIGDRQKGREQAKSIINCNPTKDDIIDAIHIALDKEFQAFCKTVINPNGDGYTSERIIKHIKEVHSRGENVMVKQFYTKE